MRNRKVIIWLAVVWFVWLNIPALAVQPPPQGLAAASHKIPWDRIFANATSSVFWLELYIHFVAICSFVARSLVPLEEWAHDPENCSPEKFRKLHSFVAFLNAYGALSKRSNLTPVKEGQEKSVGVGA